MFKIFKIFLYTLVIGTLVLVFQDTLGNTWRQLNNKYFPCRTPIKYSLGTFDEQFGISKDDFLRTVKKAEEVWEKPIGKELFEYNPEGKLKINLIYDVRQEATTKLKNLGIAVGDDKGSYQKLKKEYDLLQTKYNVEKDALEKKVNSFQEKQEQYEKEVTSWNEKGGANEEIYQKLNDKKQALEKEVVEIKKKQASLNKSSEDINALVVIINRMIASLNIQVEDLNTIGRELGEFEEGTYETSAEGEKIEIYQFDNKTKLIRVLAHEFGHALGLDHVEDEKAIMYRLNNGINEELTSSDLSILRELCKLN